MNGIKLAEQFEIEAIVRSNDKHLPERDELRRNSFIENGYVYIDHGMEGLIVWS